MASRWHPNPRPSSRSSNRPSTSKPESPIPGLESPIPGSSSYRSGRHPSEHSTVLPPWLEPQPLDDNCAKYILSVMVFIFRQTATPDDMLMMATPAADISFRDFESLDMMAVPGAPDSQVAEQFVTMGVAVAPDVTEPSLRTRASGNSIRSGKLSISSAIPIPASRMSYEKTHTSLVKSPPALNKLIAKFAGRIVFHISASNWKVVLYRLRKKIHLLANTPMSGDGAGDMVDLDLMTHSALNRERLVQVLNGMT